MNEPSCDFEYPSDELEPGDDPRSEVFAMALRFDQWIGEISRTPRAAEVRRQACLYIVNRIESPKAICKRLKISRSRFFEVVAEMREKCGLAKSKPDSVSSVGRHETGLAPV